MNSQFWETNRVYYIDMARGTEAEKAMARSVNVSFKNNNLVPIDIMVFNIYLNEFTIDVESGIVTQ